MNGLIAHTLICDDLGRILVLKRSKIKRGKPNFQAGKWDIPGGTVEKGELPRCAAAREAKEETGLDVNILNIIYERSNYDSIKNKVFTTLIYKCELVGSNEIILDPEEHSEYRWIDLNEVLGQHDDYVDYMPELIKTII